MRAEEFPNDLIQLTVHHAYAQLLYKGFMVFCSVSRGIIIKLLKMHFSTSLLYWLTLNSVNDTLVYHAVFYPTLFSTRQMFLEKTLSNLKNIKLGRIIAKLHRNWVLKTSHPAYPKCFYQISCHLKNMLISSINGTSSNGECILK